MSKKEVFQPRYIACCGRDKEALSAGDMVDLVYRNSDNKVVSTPLCSGLFGLIELPPGVSYELIEGVYLRDDLPSTAGGVDGRWKCFTRKVSDSELLDRTINWGGAEPSQEEDSATKNKGVSPLARQPLRFGNSGLPSNSSSSPFKNNKIAVVGATEFRKIRQSLAFVDKTLFIKALLEGTGRTPDKEEVTVITRPRRMGKTAIVEMVRAFFSKKVKGKETRSLFEGLKIFKIQEYREIQGAYPTIFVTFKDASGSTLEDVFHKIKYQIRDAYKEHMCRPKSLALKEEFEGYESAVRKFISAEMKYTKENVSTMQLALKDLTEYLYEVYDENVVVLIDEYDTPLLSGADNGFLPEISQFMEGILKPLFKGNGYLYKGLVTGILRVSNANIFSELNNVAHFSVLSSEYSSFFGFTEEEVKNVLEKVGLSSRMSYLRMRYGYYLMGGNRIYNPWSLIGDLLGLPDRWVHSSDNSLIKKILIHYGEFIQKELCEFLLQKKIKLSSVYDNSNYQVLSEIGSESPFPEEVDLRCTLISFLLHCGYLSGRYLRGKGYSSSACELFFPNFEILNFFSNEARIKCLKLADNVCQDIRQRVAGIAESINRADDSQIYNKPQKKDSFFRSRLALDIARNFEDSGGVPVVVYGLTGSGRGQVIDRYVLDNQHRYSYVFILKHFCGSTPDRESECSDIMSQFFNTPKDPDDEVSKTKTEEFLEKLSVISEWLVVIEPIWGAANQESMEIVNDLIRIQSQEPGKNLLIKDRKRQNDYNGPFGFVEVSLPNREESVALIADWLGISIPPEGSLGRSELKNLLHRVAYYANYRPSRMKYFAIQIIRKKGSGNFSKGIESFLKESSQEKVKDVIDNGNRSLVAYIDLLNTLGMGSARGVNRLVGPSAQKCIRKLHKLLGGSKKMMALYMAFSRETSVSWSQDRFSERLNDLKNYLGGVENKKTIFYRFLTYLLDFSDGEGLAYGARRRVMALSLFYSGEMGGYFTQSFLNYSPEYIAIDDLLGFRFLFGSGEDLGSLSMDDEIWTALREATLSLYSDKGQVLGWTEEKAIQECQHISAIALDLSKRMLDYKIRNFDQILFFRRPLLFKDSFTHIVKVILDFYLDLSAHQSVINLSQEPALICQLACLLYMYDDFDGADKILTFLPDDLKGISMYIFSSMLQGKIFEKRANFKGAVECYKNAGTKVSLGDIRQRQEIKLGASKDTKIDFGYCFYNEKKVVEEMLSVRSCFLLKLLSKLDRYEDATEVANQLESEIQNHDPNSPIRGRIYLSLANYYCYKESYFKAEEKYALAHAIFSRHKDWTLHEAESLFWWGDLLRIVGRVNDASEKVAQAKSIYELYYPEGNRVLLNCDLAIAKILFAIRKYKESNKILQKIIRYQEGRELKNSLELVDVYQYAMRVSLALHVTRSAKEAGLRYFEKAMRVLIALSGEASFFLRQDNSGARELMSSSFLNELGFGSSLGSYVRVFHPMQASLIHYAAFCYASDGELLASYSLLKEALLVNIGRLLPANETPDLSWGNDKLILASDLFLRNKRFHPTMTLYELARRSVDLGRYSEALSLLSKIEEIHDMFSAQGRFFDAKEKVQTLLFQVYFILGLDDLAKNTLRRMRANSQQLVSHIVNVNGESREGVDIGSRNSERAKEYAHLAIFLDLRDYCSGSKMRESLAKITESLTCLSMKSLSDDYLVSLLLSSSVELGLGNFKAAELKLTEEIDSSWYERKPFSKAHLYLYQGIVYFLQHSYVKSEELLDKGLSLLERYGIGFQGDSLNITYLTLLISREWCRFLKIEKYHGDVLSREIPKPPSFFVKIKNEYIKIRQACLQIRGVISKEIERKVSENKDINENIKIRPFIFQKELARYLSIKVNLILCDKKWMGRASDPSLNNGVFFVDENISNKKGGVYSFFYHPVWRHMLVGQTPFWYRIKDHELRSNMLGILTNFEEVVREESSGPFYVYLVLELIFITRGLNPADHVLDKFNSYMRRVDIKSLGKGVKWVYEAANYLFKADNILEDPLATTQKRMLLKQEIDAFIQSDLVGVPSRGFYLFQLRQIMKRFYSSPLLPSSELDTRSNLQRFIQESFRWIVPKAGFPYEGSEREFSKILLDSVRPLVDRAISVLVHTHCCVLVGPSSSGRSVIAQGILHEEKNSIVLWFSQSEGMEFDTMIRHYVSRKEKYHLRREFSPSELFRDFISRSLSEKTGLSYVLVLEGFNNFKEFYDFFCKYFNGVLNSRCRLIALVSGSSSFDGVQTIMSSHSIIYSKELLSSSPPKGSLRDSIFQNLEGCLSDELRACSLRQSIERHCLEIQEHRGDHSGLSKKLHAQISDLVVLLSGETHLINLVVSSFYQIALNKKKLSLESIISIFIEKLKIPLQRNHAGYAKVKFQAAFSVISHHPSLMGEYFLGGEYRSSAMVMLLKGLSFFEIDYLSIDLIDLLATLVNNEFEKFLPKKNKCPEATLLMDDLTGSSILTRTKSKVLGSCYRMHPITREIFNNILSEKTKSFAESLLATFLEKGNFDYARHNPKTVISSEKYICYVVQFLYFLSKQSFSFSSATSNNLLELVYRVVSYYLFHLRIPSSALDLLLLYKPEEKLGEENPRVPEFQSLEAYASLLLHRYGVAESLCVKAISWYDKRILPDDKRDEESPLGWAYRIKRGLLRFSLALIDLEEKKNFRGARRRLDGLIQEAEFVPEELKEYVKVDEIILAIELIRVEAELIRVELESIHVKVEPEFKSGKRNNVKDSADGVSDLLAKWNNMTDELKNLIGKLKKEYTPRFHSRIVVALLLQAKLCNNPFTKKRLLQEVDEMQRRISPLGNSNMQTVESYRMRSELYYRSPQTHPNPYIQSRLYITQAIELHDDIFNVDPSTPHHPSSLDLIPTLDLARCYYHRGRVLLFCGRYREASEDFKKAKRLHESLPVKDESFSHQIEVRNLTALFHDEQTKKIREELENDSHEHESRSYKVFECKITLFNCLDRQDRFDSAQKAYDQALDMLNSLYHKVGSRGDYLRSSDLFSPMLLEHMLGWSAFIMGNYSLAIFHAKKAHSIITDAKKMFVSELLPTQKWVDSSSWFFDTLMAFSFFKSGDYLSAFESVCKSLHTYEEKYLRFGIPAHPKVSESLMVLISVVQTMKSYFSSREFDGHLSSLKGYLSSVVSHNGLSNNKFYCYLKREVSFQGSKADSLEIKISDDDLNCHADSAFKALAVINEKLQERRESIVSDLSSRGRTDSSVSNGDIIMLDINTLKDIERNGQGAEAVFRFLAENGYSWSRILRENLYGSKLSDAEVLKGEELVTYLIGARSKVDEIFFTQAVEEIFGECGLSQTQQKFSYKVAEEHTEGLNKAGNDYKLRYYSIKVSKKFGRGKFSDPLFKLKVIAAGSTELSSDVDASIEVQIPGLGSGSDNIELDAQRFSLFKASIEKVRVALSNGLPDFDAKNFLVENLDIRMALQAVVVYQFNQLGFESIGMSSAMSRDSNVYAKDTSSDEHFLKFRKGLDVPINGKEFFSAQDFKDAKAKKQKLRMAASLVSMREYYGKNHDAWKEFCDSFKVNLPLNAQPAGFRSWLKEVTDLADQWYEDRENEIDNKMLALESAPAPAPTLKASAADGPSESEAALPLTFRKGDQNNYIRGELYALSLLRLAEASKKLLDGSAAHERKEMESLLKELKETEAKIAKKELTKKRVQSGARGASKEDDKEFLELLDEALTKLEGKRKETVPSLNNKKESSSKKIQAEAQLKVDFHEKEIEASFRALDAYPSPDAIYHTVHWRQSQDDRLPIARRQVVMGSICQQIAFYLLHLQAYRDSDTPEGEALYKLAKYGERIADMLYGPSDSWFDNKVSFWSRHKSRQENSLLSRLLKGHEGVVDIPDRRILDFILNRDVKLVADVKKNRGVKYNKKADAALESALIEYYKFMYGKGLHPAIREEVQAEFNEFRFKREPQVLINLMRNIIRTTFEVKLSHAEEKQDNHEEVEAWGQTFKLS